MPWKVIDKLQNDKPIESHNSPFAAQRALHILTAHELLNGRKAHYAIDPPIIEACPPTLDELKLPDWALQALVNATDDNKLALIKIQLDAEVKLSDEINAELAAEEKAADLVAKQVQEGKVAIAPDGEVLAREVYMRKYARDGESWEATIKRVMEESKSPLAEAASEHLRQRREETSQAPEALDALERSLWKR